MGRAALGHSFVELDPEALAVLVQHIPRRASYTLLDAPQPARESADPWGPLPPATALDLMRRVKTRFDPAYACNPGVFVGGI